MNSHKFGLYIPLPRAESSQGVATIEDPTDRSDPTDPLDDHSSLLMITASCPLP